MYLKTPIALLIFLVAVCLHLSQPCVTFGQQKQEKPKANNQKTLVELAKKAMDAFRAGKYQEAFDANVKLCKLEPNVVRFQFRLGEIAFAAGKMKESIGAYDETIRLEPEIEPSLWQRGLALYYADRFADGVKQFETHQTVNSQDVENAVWHLLCASRISNLEEARKKLIPINRDRRIPMADIYEMFAGRKMPAEILKAGQATSAQVKPGTEQHNLQLYYAHLYTGLYHEMLGKPKLTIASLKEAEKVNPLGKTNFMGQVARVHLQLRLNTVPKKKPVEENESTKQKTEADKE